MYKRVTLKYKKTRVKQNNQEFASAHKYSNLYVQNSTCRTLRQTSITEHKYLLKCLSPEKKKKIRLPTLAIHLQTITS